MYTWTGYALEIGFKDGVLAHAVQMTRLAKARHPARAKAVIKHLTTTGGEQLTLFYKSRSLWVRKLKEEAASSICWCSAGCCGKGFISAACCEFTYRVAKRPA